MFFQMNNHSNKSNPTRITSRIPRILLTVCLPLLSLISQNWIICWFTSMELKIFWWFEFLWNSIHDCNHFWLFLNHFPPSFPFPFLQTMADKSDDGSMVTRVFVPRLGVKKTVRLNPVIPSSHILFNERSHLSFSFFSFQNFLFQIDTVWTIKRQFVQKLALPADETLNYGIYLPKAGVYLEEQRTLASYYFSDNVKTRHSFLFFSFLSFFFLFFFFFFSFFFSFLFLLFCFLSFLFLFSFSFSFFFFFFFFFIFLFLC